jgi:capsular exopolysaccharide synthesis family protein
MAQEQQLLDQPVMAEEFHAGAGVPLWEIVRRRKSYIALGAVLGVVGGVLFYFLAPRTYESTAQVLVVKKRPAEISTTTAGALGHGDVGGLGIAAFADEFLDTHLAVVRSSVVIGNAVTKRSLAELDAFRESNKPVTDIIRSVTVMRDRDKSAGAGRSHSQILNVSFRCGVADDCGTVLSAVIESYQDFLSNSNQSSAKEALELFKKARDLVQNDLDKKEKEYGEFRRNSPYLWKTGTGTTLYQERLANIDAQRASMNIRTAQIRATLAAVDEAIKKGRSRAEVLDLVNALPARTVAPRAGMAGLMMTPAQVMTDDGGMGQTQSTLEGELIQLQLQDGKLLQDFGQQHPQVLALRDRMQTLRGLLAPSTTPASTDPAQRGQDERAKEHLVDLKIGQMKQELTEIERTGGSLNALFKTELEEAKKAFPYETQEDYFRHSIERSQTLFDDVIKRLDELDAVSSFGGYDAQVITPPTESEKVSPRGVLVFPLALVLGLMLGGGLAYLAEATDTSFRSPEEIRRRLGLQVLGLVPVLKQDAAALRKIGAGEALLDPSLCAYYRPKSKDAEAYRGVRTSLYFSTRGQRSRVIQVTSPNAYDGKSTLAANLAISIAQSGKRVLLVDGDLRRPRVDKLFGVPNRVGFASVLTGQAEPQEAIQQTQVPGLSVLPSGPLPANPAELLTSARFQELLGWLGEQFDYVLLDSPPLLAVTDPSVVAPRVDGVILALRQAKRSRVEAERAKEILATLGGNVLGVVVNAVSATQSSYGYGYYYYGTGKSGYYEDDSSAAEGRPDEPVAARRADEEEAPPANGQSAAEGGPQ